VKHNVKKTANRKKVGVERIFQKCCLIGKYREKNTTGTANRNEERKIKTLKLGQQTKTHVEKN